MSGGCGAGLLWAPASPPAALPSASTGLTRPPLHLPQRQGLQGPVPGGAGGGQGDGHWAQRGGARLVCHRGQPAGGAAARQHCGAVWGQLAGRRRGDTGQAHPGILRRWAGGRGQTAGFEEWQSEVSARDGQRAAPLRARSCTCPPGCLTIRLSRVLRLPHHRPLPQAVTCTTYFSSRRPRPMSGCLDFIAAAAPWRLRWQRRSIGKPAVLCCAALAALCLLAGWARERHAGPSPALPPDPARPQHPCPRLCSYGH